MKISRLKINNFRSIKNLTIEPESLCALIGPNSVGKTNILRGIDLVLGEGWTTKAKVAKELFYDPSEPILIEINFDPQVEYSYIDKYKKDGKNIVNSIRLEMRLEPELFVKTTINNGQDFYYQENFKKECHFIYIPADRNLTDELRVSQWTLLGKLMKLVYENYLKYYKGNEESLKNDFSEKIKSAKEFLESDFNPEVVTFKKFVDTFQKYCEINSGGLGSKFTPKLNIYNLNWFYKTLQISIKEDKFLEKDFDAEEVGTGMQNLLLISIFQTYAELMGRKVIFGIEEPENFLYPNAQRSLYHSFREISRQSQIFYTTHNPNFIDAFYAYEIEILRKTEKKGTIALQKNKDYLTSKTAEKEKFRIYSNFNPERNEIFFAKKILLVEGAADKILWTTLCEKRWNFDLNKNGVSIIECGGRGGVNYFVGVCKLVGIQDYFAIWDQDSAEEYNPRKDWLTEIKSSKGIEIPKNLEKFLKLPEGKDADKVKNAYKWAIDEKNEIPELFLKVKNFLELENREEEINNNFINEVSF